MRVFFESVHGADPATYIHSLLTRSMLSFQGYVEDVSGEQTQAHVSNALKGLGSCQVPLTKVEEHYKFTREQQAEVDKWKRNAEVALNRLLPLAPDEFVEEDFFTYLKAPYIDHPANTAVLRRKTNQAILYIVFDHIRVEDGNVISLASAGANLAGTEETATIRPMAGLDLTGIAENLGAGLAKGFGGKLGALIFDSIVPTSVPSYFDEVYKKISELFKQAVAQNTIDQINGRVNGVMLWAKDTYGPRKRAKEVPRKELLEMLTPNVDVLYREAVGPLKVDAFKKAGLGVYLITASIHLALIQEQALVDPDQLDPNLSSFAETVRLNASQHVEFVRNTYVEMLQERKDSITLTSYAYHQHCGGSGMTYSCDVQTPHWIVKDVMTGYEVNYYDDCNHENQEEAAKSDFKTRTQAAQNQLAADLGHPGKVVDYWRTLIDTPIPPQANN